MEEKKKKKKKLTLSGFAKKTHNVPHFAQGRGKTSVVIEKKTPRRWGEKKFQSRDNNFNKPKVTGSFVQKKIPINKNLYTVLVGGENQKILCKKNIMELQDIISEEIKSLFG